MATTVAAPIVLESSPAASKREQRFGAALGAVLTVLAVAVSGYHPYAEDGGLYMAGVKWLLDPKLYPHETVFVTEHLRFSVFAHVMAGLVRWSHLGLEAVFFGVYVASIWATLFAAWLVAARCFRSRTARCGAVALLAVWLMLPIAGTSLMLMDPYVTARSISTPCALLALAGALGFFVSEDGEQRRGLLLMVAALVVAGAMHPLMAGYALACVLVLACVASESLAVRRWGTAALCVGAVTMAEVVSRLAPPESAIYRQAAVTRYYWFLSRWHWYEWMGLVAPLVILAVIAFGRREGNAARAALARMSVVCGVMAMGIALVFARVDASNYLVARMQPLRVFQIVYVVMILLLGAAAAKWMLRRHAVRWTAALAVLGGLMTFAEWQTFPDSAHLELPGMRHGSAAENQWEQAFQWIKLNTPKNALFALDAHYISEPGEDAQCFRALAERSALPDYSKDGGEVSITPALAPAWAAGEGAQKGLSKETDARRIAALAPLGVDWVVLDRNAATGFSCGFENGAVKVCQLPQTVVASRR
ncbi:hypothetical protein GCM10011507_31110 [Edaphobacter acidisoli]|uniref:Uncharacterized protein n=1 Tax=Edaphobacter acidisoli TaxID=2040573 RepID=A0A916W8F3_9BACT|nr:hypothetical protein [Edaphobacter acidisoli]GGA77655.1 hypothetical protein GCM10011507_31110 [Edaphobacter acidisoli]